MSTSVYEMSRLRARARVETERVSGAHVDARTAKYISTASADGLKALIGFLKTLGPPHVEGVEAAT